ncbi:MAG: ferrous iron transport protein B, partial [Bacteroidales bacterium]
MLLSELKTGESATIAKVMGYGAFRKRVVEMGFIRGKEVTAIHNAPLKDPIIYKVMGYEVSLRHSEATMVEVIPNDSSLKIEELQPELVQLSTIEELRTDTEVNRGRIINIALVGNPNCGKTSLFNKAASRHEHVGNYSGVTVDAQRGAFKYNGYKFVIYDLPGTYALSAYTPEEVYVRKHIVDSKPDVIINVVAASNLERNLYLTTELIDMDIPMVIALNMYDELEASGAKLDYETLGSLLGVPIIPTDSRRGDGFDALFNTVVEVFENRNSYTRHIHVNHGADIEKSIDTVKVELKKDKDISVRYSARYLAIKMLEGDKRIENILSETTEYEQWNKLRNQEVAKIERTFEEPIETAISDQKYGFIAGALKETLQPSAKERKQTTQTIDAFVTHKFLGFPIFLFIMWAMFQTTFVLGAYPMEWIELLVELISKGVSSVMSDGMFKDLIVDGIIGGVGGVIVFLPNIVILYLFISVMEDSGYMARAAFIMDKLMHQMGLHGKSFIPLLMGFGCNVPAIMATRTIESRSSRLITIFINPFISCGARLPVYLLFVGIFFSKYSGTMLFAIYLLGIIIAIITARILRRFIFQKDDTPFVMELPPYRIPTRLSILIHMWEKSWQYLKKMGGIILVASIVIWFLDYFPRASENEPEPHSYSRQLGELCTPIMEPL